MASSYLVVHVVDADINVPSSSNSTSVTSYYVELRFNGQSARTETKENAKWDQTIRFHMRNEQQGDDDGDHPSVSGGDLHLEAVVYSIDETSSSETLLGKAVIGKKDFDSHSSKAGLFPHDLLKVCSGGNDDPELTRFRQGQAVVNGKLTLRVFHSAADDKALFEIEEDNHRARQTEDGGDKVDKIFKYLFSSKDPRYGEEDKNKTTSGGCGDGGGGSSSTALRPGDEIWLRRIEPRFEPGFDVVERMQFLFVVVVKARGLPDVDAYGRLDPFVEVNFGAYNKGITKCLKRDDNPEWNKTFAFPLRSGKAPSSPGVDVVVKDGDLVRDEFVGKLYFYLKDIPESHPDDQQPEPTWHPLLDERGKATLGKASLLLAIWIGSQADEAYRHAWESPYGPKVYENPRLWCLRVTIVEVQGVVACDDEEGDAAVDGDRARSLKLEDELFCEVWLGDQVRTTRPAAKTMQTTSSGSYEWREEDLIFIAAQPFFESNLEVNVVATSSLGSENDHVIGQLTIPLAKIDRLDVAAYGHYDSLATHAPQWFDLKNPPYPHSLDVGDQGGVFGANVSHMRIRLRTLLDGGYHIGHDPQGYLDDTRPAERQLWEPPIGRLHLGILSATGLRRDTEHWGGGDTTASVGPSSPLKPYCVAKYGDKWVRTRTIIESSDPVFNEQYTWDVYDIATVLNVGVFDHCTVRASSAHHKIGKVRIHLSSLETDRVYAHAYPLVTLTASGVIKNGELRLALKISLPSTANTLRAYTRPTLPRMHYVQPLNEEQEGFLATVEPSNTKGKLWSQASNILALRLDRIEPPLRKEVVAYMCNVEGCNKNLWSLRRSKANFYRLTALASPVIALLRWFEGVRSWRNPLVTLLLHAILVLALWFRGLVLPLVLLYVALAGVRNYQYRPQMPTHIDLILSHALQGLVHPDELEEEFDTYPTSQRNDDLVRKRYDRLRSVAGRIQTVAGDVATHFERIQSLLSWRDPRATAIFMLFLLIAAAVACFLPYKKLLLAVAGFYMMRHPRLRTRGRTPSIFKNFFMRLPSKQDMVLMSS